MGAFRLAGAKMASPSWWSRRKPSEFLIIAFAAYLVAGALYVPLVFQYWTYPKRWLFIVMVFAGILGLAASRLGRWKLLDTKKRLLVPALVVVILVSSAAWIYTVATATEDDYVKMADGQAYVVMAQSLIDNHTFLWAGGPSEHYGPLYPLYLVPFYLVSRDLAATKAAILIMGASALAVIYFTTRRLYGGLPALVTMGVVISMPTLLLMTSRNLSEFFMVMLYTLTIYWLYRSLEPGKQAYVILAGLFAGLTYLTKSSMGFLFLFAGAAGVLWRFKYARWGMVRDRNYLAAVLVFLGIVVAWTVRNLYVFWRPYMGRDALLNSWNGDRYFNGAFNYAIPGQWERLLLLSLVFAAFMIPFLLSMFWPFLGELRAALARIGDQRISLLTLGSLLPLAFGAVLSSMYYIWERYRLDLRTAGWPEAQASYFILNSARYAVISVVPLLWLVFEVRRARTREGGQEATPGLPG